MNNPDSWYKENFTFMKINEKLGQYSLPEKFIELLVKCLEFQPQ